MSYNMYNSTISIHALLAESDKGTCNLLDAHRVFLSTLSLRRATVTSSTVIVIFRISIHALLAESDLIDEIQLEFNSLISIHALLAESDPSFSVLEVFANFISIHALLAESDL